MPETIHKIIDEKNPPRILLIFGEEEFLVSRAIEVLIEKFTNPNLNFQLEKYDGNNISLEDIAVNANTASFFSEKKLMIVRDFDKCLNSIKKNQENPVFSNYLKNPNPNTFLVLQSSNSLLNGLSKSKTKNQNLPYPFNHLVQKFVWIEYPKVWPSEYEEWLAKQAKMKKLDIEPQAISLLVSRSGENLRTLWNELEKLQIYCIDKSKITLQDVMEVAGYSKESNVFDLQKYIIKKDLKNAIKILNEILSIDRQEMLIISILQKFFIQLFKLHDMDLNQNKFALAKSIGVNPFFIDDYLTAIKIYKPENIVNALNQLMIADEQIKSYSSDNIIIMTQMIIKIINGSENERSN